MEIQKYEIGGVDKRRILELAKQNDYSKMELIFCSKRMKRDYWESKPAYTFKDVIRYKTPQFNLIEKYHGEETAHNIIEYILTSAAVYFEELEMSEIEIKLASRQILMSYDPSTGIGGYPGMTIQDLRLCINMGVTGQFGKSYGKYKTSDLLGKDGWITKYHEYKKAQISLIEDEKKLRRF